MAKNRTTAPKREITAVHMNSEAAPHIEACEAIRAEGVDIELPAWVMEMRRKRS